MTKERGQTAFGALVAAGLVDDIPWPELHPRMRICYAIMETASRNAAFEEAAKTCDQWTGAKHTAHDMKTGVFPKQSYAPEALAAALRAMKEPEA